jgi:hypothetical protein
MSRAGNIPEAMRLLPAAEREVWQIDDGVARVRPLELIPVAVRGLFSARSLLTCGVLQNPICDGLQGNWREGLLIFEIFAG